MGQRKFNFFKKLFKSYKISIYQRGTYVKVVDSSISRFKVAAIVFAIIIVVAGLSTLMFFYTPAKYLVPGYPANTFRQTIINNALKIDSLEAQITFRDNYLEKIQSVIKGEIVQEETYNENNLFRDNEFEAVASNDSIFDNLINIDAYKFSFSANEKDPDDLSTINFFAPLNGIVINKFVETPGHWGVDIVGKTNAPVSSIYDGTVIFAEWSIQTGYVVQIQHTYNLVSIYKHNSSMLVKQGQKVKTGDIIAIMGNEGELSTGPHLHFEMWQNGKPLNPENFISF